MHIIYDMEGFKNDRSTNEMCWLVEGWMQNFLHRVVSNSDELTFYISVAKFQIIVFKICLWGGHRIDQFRYS